MSRSRRKTKAMKMCGGDSDKKDKRLANRAFRRLEKMKVQETIMSDDNGTCHHRKIFDPLKYIADLRDDKIE